MPRRQSPAAHKRLAQAIQEIDAALPGSIVVRTTRCGKASCHCKHDPPVLHGPYIQWTRAVRGKTVTKYLSEEQLERYQPWFDNARRLRKLLSELEAASLLDIKTAEGWTDKP
jgi:hypothetical protein